MDKIQPLYPHYFADPFVLQHAGTYYAYGTGMHGRSGTRAFEVLSSGDLQHWTSHGGALEPLGDGSLDYWAPEVAWDGERFYMYYSAGHGDQGHHLRVAVAEHPLGPFRDTGRNLTPDEPFAIDPHPFQDVDGQWYLFFAKDFLDGERPGTALAVCPLYGMTELAGPPVTVLRASADWQVFQRDRLMYGRALRWHTLEGAFVVHRNGTYHCFYSGGNWTNDTYGIGHAVADHPLGPWSEPTCEPVVLRTTAGGLRGPGHNSVIQGPDGRDHLVFHAWNPDMTKRQLHVTPLEWDAGTPRALVLPSSSATQV